MWYNKCNYVCILSLFYSLAGIQWRATKRDNCVWHRKMSNIDGYCTGHVQIRDNLYRKQKGKTSCFQCVIIAFLTFRSTNHTIIRWNSITHTHHPPTSRICHPTHLMFTQLLQFQSIRNMILLCTEGFFILLSLWSFTHSLEIVSKVRLLNSPTYLAPKYFLRSILVCYSLFFTHKTLKWFFQWVFLLLLLLQGGWRHAYDDIVNKLLWKIACLC